MIKKISSILLVLICLISGGIFIFYAEAKSENDINSLVCISHRGDSAEYESNSLKAVVSAFDKGSDLVSVNIRKTAEGDFVLCEENKETVSGDSLKELLNIINEGDVLVLDFEASLKDELYDFLKTNNTLTSVIFRINDSAKNITDWIKDKDGIQVMGIYDSFVVFTAADYINALAESGMDFVQYQSKNYFNEMFGSVVSGRLFSSSAKAVIPAYDPDLCGQRRDSEDGWNELIKLGFSVIETNNVESFVRYKESNNKARSELEKIYNKALTVDGEKYNTVSRENLADSILKAEQLLNRSFASSDEYQSAASTVASALENLAFKTGEDTQKGALNITAGKIIAAVVAGAVILAAQIYTYKMQKRKKK
jgi:hypothetical protein